MLFRKDKIVPNADDTERFVQILTRHQSVLRTFIHAIVLDWHAAEDVLQETNAVLWRKSHQFEFGTNFRAWAFAIANNQARSARLKFSREKQRFSDAAAEQIAADATDRFSDFDNRREALELCYQKLNDRQRGMLCQRYTDNQSIVNIAESTSRPVGSIRQTLYLIRRSLAECIRRKLGGEVSS